MADDCSNFDSEFVPVSECIPPLRVCVDNETFEDCTLLRVEGENLHGILLQIVQALSDLDLIISKASISADGGWFMNVFHVTDHHGHKLRDPSFIRYMQRSLDGDQEGNGSCDIAQPKICRDNKVNVEHFTSDCIALEISSVDCPGIFSEVTTVLFKLSCMVDTGEVWTHNGCAACIFYLKDRDTGRSISDRARLSCLLKNISTVVEAHHLPDKLWGVRLRPAAYRIHTERRLHQLMHEQMDYQVTPPPSHAKEDLSMLAISVVEASKRRFAGDYKGKQVAWSLERDYFVVTVRSRDTPKLMFDAMCTLTDLNYDVLRGSVSSNGRWAIQEYSVRRFDGCGMLNEVERQSLVRSLKAAIERRQPHGLRMEMRTLDRPDLLLDVSKVFQQNGLSINKAEFAKQKDMAVGTFYITDASSSSNVNAIDQQKLEAIHKAIGDGTFVEKKNDCECNTKSPAHKRWSLCSMICSFGGAIWSHIKRLFSIFPRFR
ncbi:hypothetical protein IEQ34_003125 [Dendrobium chrysotoxum]|uniref:ACT domain-containing protein ACR n=1 Tax=Dendrobium chrysotoxum TaxID=161865 RepID=A0AAV7HJS9_DENCH|nr:hypothetical protein IEQ34_003125 [Dendrobium chrysotoxum]